MRRTTAVLDIQFPLSTGYLVTMKIYGSIVENLSNALASAQRLRGHPVYKDTLAYWGELIQEARKLQREPAAGGADELEDAIVKLEVELAERPN